VRGPFTHVDALRECRGGAALRRLDIRHAERWTKNRGGADRGTLITTKARGAPLYL
jgi:hypothetical protein